MAYNNNKGNTSQDKWIFAILKLTTSNDSFADYFLCVVEPCTFVQLTYDLPFANIGD